MFIFRLIVLCLLFVSSNSMAKIIFKGARNFKSTEITKVQEFINDIESLIPSKMNDGIKKEVFLEFVSFNENKNIKELPVNKCDVSANILYAQVNSRKTDTIKISKLFLPEILKGESGSTKFNCDHGSYYRKAIATVLHEIAHIYDYQKILTEEHKEQVGSCYDSRANEWDNSPMCQAVHMRDGNRNTISGLYEFLKLTNWEKTMFSAKPKNLSSKRSVDPYENKNLEEHYAVNFEYFIMDPQYKCRRPSYYKFFSNELSHHPYENEDCEINTTIFLDDKGTSVDIAPDRVFRVDYLLASKGEGITSGFGHSMFRLIVCAPFRKEVNEDCLKDKLYHVVLSYRANVTDIKSNALKGLKGGYDSILYMLAFPKVVEEYNMGELRDLMSLPIHFSKEQKENFILKVLETYWEYSGDYKFLSNNCASESFDLLQAAMLDHPIKYGNVIMPYSLMEVIIERGLSNDNYFEDVERAVADGVLFQSDAEKLAAIKEELIGREESDYVKYRTVNHRDRSKSKVIERKKDIKDIISAIETSKLQEIYDDLLETHKEKQLKEKLNELSILAQGILNIKQHELDEEVGTYLEDHENDDNELGESIRNWKAKRKNFRISPIDRGYGIPAKVSEKEVADFKNRNKELEETEETLVKDVKDNYKEKVDELLTIHNLIESIRNKTKIISMEMYLQQE